MALGMHNVGDITSFKFYVQSAQVKPDDVNPGKTWVIYTLRTDIDNDTSNHNEYYYYVFDRDELSDKVDGRTWMGMLKLDACVHITLRVEKISDNFPGLNNVINTNAILYDNIKRIYNYCSIVKAECRKN